MDITKAVIFIKKFEIEENYKVSKNIKIKGKKTKIKLETSSLITEVQKI